MNNILTIVKKELKRVFTDRRVILSLFLLPPLTIYLIYGLMGMSMEKENQKVEKYHPTIYIVNSPDALAESNIQSFIDYFFTVQRPEIKKDENNAVVRDSKGNPVYIMQEIYNRDEININIVDNESINELKENLKKGQFDLIIEFSDDFNEKIDDYENQNVMPNVTVNYYMNSSYSAVVYENINYILGNYKASILNSRFTDNELNVFSLESYALGDENKAKGSFLAMILPMLLVIYLMAGAMGIGAESVAGEKERGTIATLLVTPIKRSELAIGKIISISIIAILSSISSFIGLIAVLPTFSKVSGGAEGIGQVGYAITDYGMLFSVMLVAVLLFVALILIVSTYAKSNKEAGTLVMPVYLIVVGSSFFNMFALDTPQNVTSYIIPIYNIVVSLKAILSLEMTNTNFIVTIVSTVLYTLILIFFIQKMFKSEKVMFNK